MNNSNPFIPQGSLLEQKNRKRRRFQVAVLSILGFNVLLITGLVLNGGCKPSDTTSNDNNGQTPVLTNDSVTSIPSDTGVVPNLGGAPTNPPTQMQLPPPPPPPVNTGMGMDYTIGPNDTFSHLATVYHVTIKAIEDANPGVDPKKLKVGAKIHIPAPTTAAVSGTPGATALNVTGDNVYTVKSGDNLNTIAKTHGTTLSAIRALNASVANTDKIKVGEKLKLPPSKTAPAPADPTAPPAMPPPPMSNTAAIPAPGR